MRHSWMIGTAALALAMATSARAVTAGPSPTPAPTATPKEALATPDLADEFNAGIDAFKAEQCDRATDLMTAVTASSDFDSRLEPKFQSLAFTVIGLCAETRGDWSAAYASFVRATAYPEAIDLAFTARFDAAANLSRYEDAVASLELSARVRPKAVSDLTPRRLFGIMTDLAKQADKGLRRRFFAALEQADYRPSEPFRTGSYLWVDYAADLAEAGNAAGAARVLGKVDFPDALAKAQTDRRLVAILDADPQRFDVRAMTERRLAADRQQMANHTELLEGVNEVAMDLRALGRPEEALALLDATLPKLENRTAFQDFDDKVVWTWDERSRVLRDLGRVDEAIDSLKRGAEAAVPGHPDINLVLNLADLLVWAGKPEAAIETARASEKLPASPYGHLFGEQSRACAYAQLGKSAELKAALADLHAHESDNWTAVADAELCAGDLDAAAATYIRSLSDPAWRREVLIELSQFDPPAHQTELERQMDARRAQAARRPDVRAAIAKVGRTPRIHTVSSGA